MREGTLVRVLAFKIGPSEIMDSLRTITRPMFFDRQLQPLGWEEYAILHSFRSYCRVDESNIGPLWISTVWLGTDLGIWGDDPIVFETMIFGPDESEPLHPEMRAYVDAMVRYASEDEAYQGHASVCMDVRQTLAKIEMAQEVLTEALNRKEQ
jgi:hypothetical protein